MSDDLQLSRRGLLQMVSAVVLTASFAARRPLLLDDVNGVGLLDPEPTEIEPAVPDQSRGTRLERFLRSRGIKPAHLARESGYSREQLLRLRVGRTTPTRRCIAGLVAACRRLSREAIHASDLFDLTRADSGAVTRILRRLSIDR